MIMCILEWCEQMKARLYIGVQVSVIVCDKVLQTPELLGQVDFFCFSQLPPISMTPSAFALAYMPNETY